MYLDDQSQSQHDSDDEESLISEDGFEIVNNECMHDLKKQIIINDNCERTGIANLSSYHQ